MWEAYRSIPLFPASSNKLSSLYTNLPHNLIQDKLVDLIELIFQRKFHFILHVMIDMFSSPLMQ